MKVGEVERLLKGPYKAKFDEVSGTRVAICDYMERTFWVYFFPDEDVGWMTFSFISEQPIGEDIRAHLNDLNLEAVVSKIFEDTDGHIHLTAKIVGKLEDLGIRSFKMFCECWMDDFDRILPLLHRNGE